MFLSSCEPRSAVFARCANNSLRSLSELGGLASLRELHLEHNPGLRVTPELAKLENLEYLNLGACALGTFPPEARPTVAGSQSQSFSLGRIPGRHWTLKHQNTAGESHSAVTAVELY